MSEQESSLANLSTGTDAEQNALADKIKEEKSRKRIELERVKLIEDVRSNTTNDTRQRVAHLLNEHPELRDSDRRLVPAYWRMFDNANLSHCDAIAFDELMKVTKYTSIIRARQKIQNEFGLFLGEAAIRRQRHIIADIERVRQRRGSGVPFLYVYCDESGKTQSNRLVGGIWLHAASEEVAEIQKQLAEWKKSRDIAKEISFKDARGHQIDIYVEYMRFGLTLAPAISFKAIYTSKEDSGGRAADDVIFDLYYNLIAEGVAHELATGRTSLPRSLILLKDKDDGADKLHLKNLRDRIETLCRPRFDNQLLLAGGDTVDSEKDHILQLTDLFTGSVSRVLNRGASDRNHKDEIAEAVLGLLNLSVTFGSLDGRNDKALAMNI